MNRATLELFAPLDRRAPEPLRTQLEDAICAAITGGGAPPGTRLPASRTLAEALHVSRGVVSEAYAQIASSSWARRGSGALRSSGANSSKVARFIGLEVALSDGPPRRYRAWP